MQGAILHFGMSRGGGPREKKDRKEGNLMGLREGDKKKGSNQGVPARSGLLGKAGRKKDESWGIGGVRGEQKVKASRVPLGAGVDGRGGGKQGGQRSREEGVQDKKGVKKPVHRGMGFGEKGVLEVRAEWRRPE